METAFRQKVWQALSRIPRGKVATYAQIAKAIGHPNAFRAVGNACNQNPYSPSVPCHRVVNSNGALGGYAGGIRKKIKLLKQEGIRVRNGKIVDFEKRVTDAKRLRQKLFFSSEK